MDFQVFSVLNSVLRGLGVLAALGVAGVAAGVAVYCTKKKLRPAAAWVLALSWVGLFFMLVLMAILGRFIIPRFGWELGRYASIAGELILLACGVFMAAGVGMFRPLDTGGTAGGGGREVGHGA